MKGNLDLLLVRVWAALVAISIMLSSVVAAYADDPQNLSAGISKQARPTIGLALGGGGARGAAHVSVLRVLKEAGVPIDYIAGTSIGAVVGGLYSAGLDFDVMEKKFLDASLMKAFMTVPLTVRIIVAPFMAMPRLIGDRSYDGLYKGNKFRKYLERAVPLCDRNIEDLNIPFAAVSLNIVDGKIYMLRRGNLGYAMQASSAVPGLRKPVQIGDQLFCDGGVFANVPVNQVKQMGADIVIAVCVDEKIDKVPLETFRHVGAVSTRILTLQLGELDEDLLKSADVVIHPQVDGISLISTKKSDAVKALASGETAAREALPAIKARLAAAGIVLPVVDPVAAPKKNSE